MLTNVLSVIIIVAGDQVCYKRLSQEEYQMNIAIIGASGKAGSFILKEAVSHGHKITAAVRAAR